MAVLPEEPVNADLSGGGGTLVLGGKTYLVSQPTVKDMESIKKALGVYVAKRRKTKLSRIVDDPAYAKLPAEHQKLLLEKMLADKEDKPEQPDGNEYLAILSSPEACRFASWLLLRREHPTINKQTDIDPFIDAENCDALFLELMEAAGMTSLGN